MTSDRLDVDRSFRDTAADALNSLGTTALAFIAEHPGVSDVELAQRLNRGASALGFIQVLYEESTHRGCVRQTARELLFRKIREKFPDGWFEDPKVCPIVKLSLWASQVAKYAGNNGHHGEAIAEELTRHDVPPIGWKPESVDDPHLTRIFDKCWPKDS